MSKFHESIRELLEDINGFLSKTLCNEVLSTAALTHKESILMKLKRLHLEYPQLQLSLSLNVASAGKYRPDSEVCQSPTSPLSYVDMQGGNSSNLPSVDSGNSKLADEENYDTCGSEKSSGEENQSLTEFEELVNYPPIPATDSHLFEKSGFLEKKRRERFGGLLNSFHKRWFCIKDGLMYYYEKPTDRIQKGVISLCGYEVRTLPYVSRESRKTSFVFELVCPGKRTYQFIASSDEDLKQWISVIEHNNKLSHHTGERSSQQFSSHILNSDVSSLNGTEDIYEEVDEVNCENNQKNLEIHMDTKKMDNKNEHNNFTHSMDEFDYQAWYVGLWDCNGDDKDELSFKQGDLIHVLSKEYDSYSWWVGECQGKIGFVPKAYLMEAYETY